ncbi:MAG: VTT domain-containing protein [Maricaulis sp.]|nr:VTT domain-containing protein [Maricaulis sp.]
MHSKPPENSPSPAASPGFRHAGRIAVFAVLAAVIAIIIGFGLTPEDLIDAIAQVQNQGQIWIDANPALAALAYAVFYVFMVTVSLPGALWFTIGAGYLLGPSWGFAASLVGVTLGASNIMLLTRYVLGDQFQDRFSGRIEKFAHGFQRDDFSYIILLRVVPAPFFVVNVAAALFGARWRQFVAGTFIGAIPATILYANLGAGLAELAAAGVQPTLADLTRPSFLIMIAMAALLALSPLAYRAWLKRSDV